MRAIGLRAIGLALLLAGAAGADTHQDIVDLFANMTAALADERPAGFLKSIDPDCPGRAALETNVRSLVVIGDLSSSVEFLKDEGDESKRSVDLDWYLEVRNRQPDGATQRRRETIHCELVKSGKRWRIVSINPVTLFKP